MATARLGHAHLLLRDHDVAWHAADLARQSPVPGAAPTEQKPVGKTPESRITDY
jgi:hypothetical protein